MSLSDVNRVCKSALRKSGLGEEGVEVGRKLCSRLKTRKLNWTLQAIATAITHAERDGAKSHGLVRLRGWCTSLVSQLVFSCVAS